MRTYLRKLVDRDNCRVIGADRRHEWRRYGTFDAYLPLQQLERRIDLRAQVPLPAYRGYGFTGAVRLRAGITTRASQNTKPEICRWSQKSPLSRRVKQTTAEASSGNTE